jgi:hypothetical protein
MCVIILSEFKQYFFNKKIKVMNNNKKLQVLSAVSPQPGNLYTEVLWKQPQKTIFFSPVNGHKSAALEIAIFPYGFGAFKLTWSEYVTDLETAKLATKKDGTKKYDSFRQFLNSNVVIGYRTEYVPFFKEVETHPFVVESTSAKDGVSTEIVITIITKINFPQDGGPLKIISLEDPFGFVFGFINEAILRWANSKSSKEIRMMNTDDDKNPLTKEIEINGEFYLDYLNREKFKKYEIEVQNVNLKAVVLAKTDEAVLTAEKGVVIATSNAEAAKEKLQQTLTEAKGQDAKNKVALSFYEGQLKAKTDFITNSAEALKKINSGYGANNSALRVLSIGDNKLLTELITASEAVKES